MIDHYITNHCHSIFRDILGGALILGGVFGSIAILFSPWPVILKIVGIVIAETLATFVGAPLINP